jgi:hypothetical protein
MKSKFTYLLINFMIIALQGKTGNFNINNNTHDKMNLLPPSYSPFEMVVDPMDRLLLINIENDPDSIYIGFEPQIFNDSIHGCGMIIIGWRKDGYVDVYHQPQMQLNGSKYDIAGKGLATMAPREMEGAYFNIAENGVQAWFQMNDIYGRSIEIKIDERHPGKRKPFGLLAPMGNAAENPSSLPLIWLRDFYFVRKRNTDIIIKIDNKLHKPDKLPIPIDRKKMMFTRYCPNPLIAALNPAKNGAIQPIRSSDESNFTVGENKYKMVNIDGRKHIQSFTNGNERFSIEMIFYPPFPEITSIQTGEDISGKFVIEGERADGKITGEYYLKEQNGIVYARMTPSGGWNPRPNKLSLRFLYTVVGVFKKWPTTYHWSAEINFNETGQPIMQSAWERK